MKRICLILLAFGLTACTAKPISEQPTPTEAPTEVPMPVEVEVLKEPYLDPIEKTEAEDLDDLFALTRLLVVLPDGVSETASFYAVVTRLGTACAEVEFAVDGVPMFYRVGYTAQIENLADDETTYPDRTALTYFETEYLLLLNETQGRVQWYDEKTGTSNSLFVPYNVEPRILEDTAISIMAAQRGEA